MRKIAAKNLWDDKITFSSMAKLIFFVIRSHLQVTDSELPLYKHQNFGPVQIENICRQQNKCDSKTEICFGKGRKHCGKKRKCWLPAFSPFG